MSVLLAMGWSCLKVEGWNYWKAFFLPCLTDAAKKSQITGGNYSCYPTPWATLSLCVLYINSVQHSQFQSSQTSIYELPRHESQEREPGGSQLTFYNLASKYMPCHSATCSFWGSYKDLRVCQCCFIRRACWDLSALMDSDYIGVWVGTW